MARIRSTHPGQWNDDDFLECSPLARLLCLAVRNYADDNGVFEWKPKQIKRLCLPSDPCDVTPLLKELCDNKQIIKFTNDGKEYGAIRNFRPWQRPKTPKSVYPCPGEIRKYVGLSVSECGNAATSEHPISEIEANNAPPILRKVESNLPMEEGGGRREEVGGSSEPNGSGGSADQNTLSGKPEWWPKQDRYGRIISELTDKIVFDVGKAVLGKSSGGQIKKLTRFYRDYRDVADLLLQAEGKAAPGEWIAAVIHNRERDCFDDLPALAREKYPEHSYR